MTRLRQVSHSARAPPARSSSTATRPIGWSGGQKTWHYSVEFRDVAGTVWTFEPPLSRGREQQVGTPVPMAYRPDAPGHTARRTNGLDVYLHWVFIGAGVVTAAVFPFMA